STAWPNRCSRNSPKVAAVACSATPPMRNTMLNTAQRTGENGSKARPERQLWSRLVPCTSLASILAVAQPNNYPSQRVERVNRCHPIDIKPEQLFDYAALNRGEQVHLGGAMTAFG